jgi:hypothetical protein
MKTHGADKDRQYGQSVRGRVIAGEITSIRTHLVEVGTQSSRGALELDDDDQELGRPHRDDAPARVAARTRVRWTS